MKKNNHHTVKSNTTIEADLVLHSGTVVTLEGREGSSKPAEAVAVKNGSICGVGLTKELQVYIGHKTHVIDLRGRMLLPGFFDAHPHMDREGLKSLSGISIAGLSSIPEILNVVRNAVRSAKAGDWIILTPLQLPGFRYSYVSRPEQMREGRFPDRTDLDEVAPNNPVYIRSPWGFWSRRPFPSIANSEALRLANITKNTLAPYNMEIVKDSKGEPNGVFLERNYYPAIEYTLFKVLPRFTFADRIESIKIGSRLYSAEGTTTAYEGHGLTPTLMRAYRHVHAKDRDQLTVRVHAPHSIPSSALEPANVSDLLYQYSAMSSERGTGDDLFRVDGITLGDSNTTPEHIQLIAGGYPYEQFAGFFAQALPPNEQFVQWGIEAARHGLRLNLVANYGNIEADLDALESINREVSIRDRRWLLLHVVPSLTGKQLKRIKELGLIVEVLPTLMYMASDRMGIDKMREKAIPIRELLDAEIPVVMGSDGCPTSMLWSMWMALARWDDDSKTRLGESRLTREEVLKIIQNGHMITWNEDRFGSVEVGKMADFVILRENLLTCDEERIKDIPVDITILGGKVVYERG